MRRCPYRDVNTAIRAGYRASEALEDAFETPYKYNWDRFITPQDYYEDFAALYALGRTK